MIEWKEKVGGHSEATRKILNCLKCSPSKADKIASGLYPSVPNALERQALSKLIGIEESELFPVGAGNIRAS